MAGNAKINNLYFNVLQYQYKIQNMVNAMVLDMYLFDIPGYIYLKVVYIWAFLKTFIKYFLINFFNVLGLTSNTLLNVSIFFTKLTTFLQNTFLYKKACNWWCDPDLRETCPLNEQGGLNGIGIIRFCQFPLVINRRGILFGH